MFKANFYENIKNKIDKLELYSLKSLTAELIDDHTNLRTVFNSMAEGVLVINNSNQIQYYNKIASLIFGFSGNTEGVLIDKAIKNDKLLNLIKINLQKNDKLIIDEIKLENNIIKYGTVSVQPLVKNGKIIGNIIIIEDITEKKENEIKLKQIESIAALSAITAGIAHEIKNPLGAISIHIQLLQQEITKCNCKGAGDIKYSLDIVNEEIERLNEIVVNFLYSIRPVKADFNLVDTRQYLNRICELVKPELESKNIVLLKNYSDLPQIWLDENMFKQAFINLIQNSIASIEDRGTIEISAYTNREFIVFDIKDNGKGIPEDIQSKIFDPYFTTKPSGSGLGLTIVYKVIKEHNADITFTSRPGETIFTIKMHIPFYKKSLIEYSGEK